MCLSQAGRLWRSLGRDHQEQTAAEWNQGGDPKHTRARAEYGYSKTHPAERYYEPNFPVFQAEECAEFMGLCEEMSKELAKLFEKKRGKMERAFRKTGLPEKGWELSDVTQCLFANMYRGARAELEQRGLLAARAKHANGAKWIFWAQETETERSQKIVSLETRSGFTDISVR